MGAIPSPNIAELAGSIANAPATRLQEYQRTANLAQQTKVMQQQEQELALKNQADQLAMQDQQAMRALAPGFVRKDESGKVTGYDTQGLLNAAAAHGVNPLTLQDLQTQWIKARTDLAQAGHQEFENQKAVNGQAVGMHEDLKGVTDPQQRQQAYDRMLTFMHGHGMDTSQYPQQAPDNDSLSHLEIPLGMHAQLLSDTKEQSEITKNQSQAGEASAKQKQAEATTQKVQAEQERIGHVPGVDVPYLPEVFAQKKALKPTANLMTQDDAKEIADAIENGDQPPSLQGLYRNAGPVRAELARRGVPLAKMETDWKATQRYVATLNGTQQTRLRQAISTASDSLGKIEQLYDEYHSIVGDAGLKAFNKVGLKAAKQLPGRAGAVATALDAQIADLTSELGNVYMGGNSPTDHSLSLAAKNLSSDWNRETFEEALKQARLNIGIRQNSIIHSAPAGMSGTTDYYSAPQSSGRGNIFARDPQGKLHQAPAGTPLPSGWKLEKR